MPTCSATDRAVASLSPVRRTGRRPSARRRATASALLGLTVSATRAAHGPAVPARRDTVRPAASAAARRARGRRAAAGPSEVGRSAGDERALDHTLHAEPAGWRSPRRRQRGPTSRRRRRSPERWGASDAASAHRRGAGLDAVDPVRHRTRGSSPCGTVPSCRARGVDRPGRLSTRDPDQDPRWAPAGAHHQRGRRGQPTGQAMISTDTAALNAERRRPTAPAEDQRRRSRMTIGTNTAGPDPQPLYRRLAAWACSTSALSGPLPRSGRLHESTTPVDRRTDDAVARTDLDGHASRQHGFVNRRGPSSTTPSWPPSRPGGPRARRRPAGDRGAALAVRAQHGDVLAPIAIRARSGAGGGWPGTRGSARSGGAPSPSRPPQVEVVARRPRARARTASSSREPPAPPKSSAQSDQPRRPAASEMRCPSSPPWRRLVQAAWKGQAPT